MGLALIAGAAVSAVEDAPASEHFPAPPGLEPEIQFWTRIYTEVDGRQGLLHDTRDLGVVYEQVEVPRSASPKTRERLIEGHKEKYRGILRKLGRGQRSKLSSDEARVLALFPTGVQNETLRSASRRIRFQLGQADRFRAGLIRSGAYEDHIQSTLAEMGLPAEIAALPHVESSYTPQAYSRIGAAGLWQFTRSTGRRFMRVDHVVDERLDPYLATVAAARLLEQNHRVTGSWPLAITAYNHGASGMRRAVRKLGTRDIERIVREYRGRTFGFASRNFYVEFIAASRIASSPEQHFGTFVRDSPIDYEEGEMPFYGTPSSIAQALNIPLDTLRAANPALRPSVWRGDKRIPRGFNLKVPRAELNRPIQKGLQAVPSESRHARQTRDAHHVIQRGETLSGIARAYGIRASDLQALNGLRNRHRIRAGQKLRLPADRSRSASNQSARRTKNTPSPLPPSGQYTIARGDTLQAIARRFDVTEKQLLRLNRLKNPNRIRPGQTLQIRGGAAERKSPRVVETPIAKDQESAPPASMAKSESPIPSPQKSGEKTAEGGFAEVAAEAGQHSATERSALLADPNDYSVGQDGTIEVQAMETLGHYAEWLGIRASQLRAINRLKYGQPLPVHSRLRLDFSRTRPPEFERHRLEYHQGIQEDFFSEWEISGTEFHHLERGDSLWVLSHRRFNVPLWLLRQYNPDVNFESPPEGARITVPLLKKRDWIERARAPKPKQRMGKNSHTTSRARVGSQWA